VRDHRDQLEGAVVPSVQGLRLAGAGVGPSAAAGAEPWDGAAAGRPAAAPSGGHRLGADRPAERPAAVARQGVAHPAAVGARRPAAAGARRWGAEARLGEPVRSPVRPGARL